MEYNQTNESRERLRNQMTEMTDLCVRWHDYDTQCTELMKNIVRLMKHLRSNLPVDARKGRIRCRG